MHHREGAVFFENAITIITIVGLNCGIKAKVYRISGMLLQWCLWKLTENYNQALIVCCAL